MVICGILVDESRLDELKAAGVKDSKLLTPENRKKISEVILGMVEDYAIVVVPASEIDKTLNSPDSNLNWLEADKSAEIINSFNTKRVVMDCPSTNISTFSSYVKNLLKDKSVEFICEHKADRNHVEVAAASILAKVARDREIEKLKSEIGKDFGSGYPSDPKTRDFLQKHWKDCQGIFRKTWSSYRKIVESDVQNANLSIAKHTDQKVIEDF